MKPCWRTGASSAGERANTSFVNRIADTTLPLDELVADPVQAVEKMAAQEGQIGLPHPKIALPRELYGKGRINSAGLDLANEHRLASPLPCSTAHCRNGRPNRCWNSRSQTARCSR